MCIRDSRDKVASHSQTCLCIPKECPLAALGCTVRSATSQDKLQEHMEEAVSEHFSILVAQIQSFEERLNRTELRESTVKGDGHLELKQQAYCSRGYDLVEVDGAGSSGHDSGVGRSLQYLQPPRSKTQFIARLQDTESFGLRPDKDMLTRFESLVAERTTKMQEELKRNLVAELRAKDEELAELKTIVTKLEKTIQSKNAELEDRDFRLSLIENSNHDGSMIWKIPQFSQRKADAQNGKYTSIFSLPFYSGRYGYKMCLRLYICLLYTSPSPRDATLSRMPSSA